MKPYYADDTVTLHHGDALEVLRSLPDASVDAVVTDPPYGLEFMGVAWDTMREDGKPRARNEWGDFGSREHARHPSEVAHIQRKKGLAFYEFSLRWATEAIRVLKPGGWLLAFSGTRTVHRMTCGIEDAGFEIRDGIDWLYGSGFPKSLNLGDGRGTALKPAREPIVMARKPLAGTVAANVAAHGTGALNIDACRVGDEERTNQAGGASSLQRVSRAEHGYRATVTASVGEAATVTGRWPSNVVLSHAPDCTDVCLSGCPVAELDKQSGLRPAGGGLVGTEPSRPFGTCYGDMNGRREWQSYGDTGGASRFFPVFRYEAKAATAERPRVDGVAHPTVKPLDLMRWLVRLVTPAGGVVLEPFAGSGTTAEACVLEGFRCIAIEREAAYLPLIVARLTKPLQPSLDLFGAA